MVSTKGEASAGQLASIASSVAVTRAGRMLREILPNESATATLLRLFSHFFARLRERPPLAPCQALKAAARNFFQDGIDFLGDEFAQRHPSAPFFLDSSPSQNALHKRGPAEAEEMRVKPPHSSAA